MDWNSLISKNNDTIELYGISKGVGCIFGSFSVIEITGLNDNRISSFIKTVLFYDTSIKSNKPYPENIIEKLLTLF